MKTFAVLQLTGCAGCEMSLLDAPAWYKDYQLRYMPLVISGHDVPEVDVLLVSGGVRTDYDLYNLRKAVKRAGEVVAVGTCAISGGVASLGDRSDLRDIFIHENERFHIPNLLPKSKPVDAVTQVDRYLPGCPPTPDLFQQVLMKKEMERHKTIVCAECGRKKVKDLRPQHLVGFQPGYVMEDVCLIKQGFLCIGSSTRSGCGAPCPRAGFPCVGCRGPSDKLIEKESRQWLESIKRVFLSQTDIAPEEIDEGLRSPQLALFLFQFSDYDGKHRPGRPKEKVV